ncbi:MAG: hypothetical protein LBS72_06385 [Oscillospiraceae bacterium]|jgi:myosin heavy subunit|nr:hypothetical protein [Oscillospiraceae bacterium]
MLRIRRYTAVVVLLLAAALAFSFPSEAETAAGDWLNQLPADDAATARAILEHINGQWAVVQRAADADLGAQRASDANAALQTSLDAAQQTLTDALSALEQADAAKREGELFLQELDDMRKLIAANDDASKRYAAWQEQEQKASAALDQATDDLTDAHAFAEETLYELTELENKYAESSAALSALREETEKLREQAKAPAPEADEMEQGAGQSPASFEAAGQSPALLDKAAQLLSASEADLASAENTDAVLLQQIAAAREQSDRASARVVEAEAAMSAAEAREQAALAEVEASGKALAEIQSEYNKLQLTSEELEEAFAKASADQLRAQAALDAANLKVNEAEQARDDALEAFALSAAALKEALDEQSKAAADLDDLTVRWSKYQKYTGRTTDGETSPALDLLAAEEAVPEIYAVYLTGTDIYIFKGGKTVATMSCQAGRHLGAIDLTRSANGKLSIRYVAWDGQTRLQSLGSDAPVLFTGKYETLTISSKLRKTTQFLGEACSVRSAMLHPNTALVHFGQSNPLRHAPER